VADCDELWVTEGDDVELGEGSWVGEALALGVTVTDGVRA
jgi:hypothetical protein